jgi:hypothetical protein
MENFPNHNAEEAEYKGSHACVTPKRKKGCIGSRLVHQNKLVNQTNQESAPTNAPPHYNQTIQETTEANNVHYDTDMSQDKSDSDDVGEISDKATKRKKAPSFVSKEYKVAWQRKDRSLIWIQKKEYRAQGEAF